MISMQSKTPIRNKKLKKNRRHTVLPINGLNSIFTEMCREELNESNPKKQRFLFSLSLLLIDFMYIYTDVRVGL